MKTTLHYIADAGHAWVKVNRMDDAFQAIAAEVSPYSYMRGCDVYLEEDCDACLYIDELKRRGYKLEWVETITDGYSIIRSFEPFRYFKHR